MQTTRLHHGVALMSLICLALAFSTSLKAQFLRTSYFMEGVGNRMKLNPALTPTRGFVDIPVIGAFNATANSNALGTQDVFDIIDDEGDFYNNNRFYNRLKADNRLTVGLNSDLISFGFYRGKGFWSFNVGARVDVGAQIPRTMFDFLRGMDQMENSWQHLDYDIRNGKLEINAYTELGVGYAREINERLTVGGRLKVLLGMGNLNMHINRIGIQSDINGNAYDPYSWADSKASIRVDARLESSFRGMDLVADNGYVNDLDFNGFGIGGYGGAIDLGASYRLLDKLTLSASVLDLGFISWSKGSTNVAEASTERVYDRHNYTDFIDIVESGSVMNYDLFGLELNDQLAKSRTTSLQSTVVVGAEYELLDDWLAFGVLSTTRFTKPETQTELTLSANMHPKSWLNVAASYSMIQSAGKSFGLAFKLGPVFVGTDYMFLGSNSKSVNAYLGISVPLGAKSCRN